MNKSFEKAPCFMSGLQKFNALIMLGRTQRELNCSLFIFPSRHEKKRGFYCKTILASNGPEKSGKTAHEDLRAKSEKEGKIV